MPITMKDFQRRFGGKIVNGGTMLVYRDRPAGKMVAIEVRDAAGRPLSVIPDDFASDQMRDDWGLPPAPGWKERLAETRDVRDGIAMLTEAIRRPR